MYNLIMSRLINAPAEVVWEVITDHVLFGQLAPNLQHVEVLSGSGIGMQRQCTGTDGTVWSEQCVLWKEHEQYVFEVDTSAPGYPLAKMRGTFGMDKREGGVLVTMRFDYVPRFNPPLVGWLINLVFSRAGIPPMRAIMDGWEDEIKKRQRPRAA